MITTRSRILIKVTCLKQFALEVWVSIVSKVNLGKLYKIEKNNVLYVLSGFFFLVYNSHKLAFKKKLTDITPRCQIDFIEHYIYFRKHFHRIMSCSHAL